MRWCCHTCTAYHWDRVAQQGIDRGSPIVTTPHAVKRLHRRGFGQALGVSTWQSHTITNGDTVVTLTSLPGRHAPLWGHRLFAGDGHSARVRAGGPFVAPPALQSVFASPVTDFIGEMERRGIADRVIEVERGGSVTV